MTPVSFAILVPEPDNNNLLYDDISIYHQAQWDTVDRFARRFRCSLTAAEGMEHWFHTPEQLAVLRQWEEAST